MPNFADIANKKAEDVERPPLPPTGTYRFRVQKLPTTSKSGDEAWEFLRVLAKVVEPLENVDVDSYPGDIGNVVLSKSFVFNCNDDAAFETTLFNFKQFVLSHLKVGDPSMTMSELLNATVNAEFLGDVKWNQDKRDESGETFNAEIGRTAPVE